MYEVLKIVHIVSLVGWAGTTFATLVGKSSADRTGNSVIVAHVIKRSAPFDALMRNIFSVTLLLSGVLMAKFAGLPIAQLRWLWSGLLLLCGVWVIQAWMTHYLLYRVGPNVAAVSSETDPDRQRYYRTASKVWAVVQSATLIALVWGVSIMVIKS